MSGVLLFAAIFLQCKKMGILSALRVAVANAPALRRTDVRLVDPRFANKFLPCFLIFSGIFCPEKIPTVLCHPEKNHFLPIFSRFFAKSICKKSNLCYII